MKGAMKTKPAASAVVIAAVGAALAVFSGCTSLLGDFELDGTTGGGSSSGEGGAAEGGSSGMPVCVGDTVDACGASCVRCTAPAGGTVDCVNGACEQRCPGAQRACADTCVDTSTSRTHCGRCDRDCGAGACTTGACEPYPVVTGLTNVHAIAMSPSGLVISAGSDVTLCANASGCTLASLATIRAGVSQLNDVTVAGTDVYFDGNEGDSEIVYRCPVAGCPGAGPAVVENEVNDSIGRVVAGPTNVVWTRYQSYYGPYSRRCALPGCGSIADVRPEPNTGPYYNDPARELTVPSQIVSVGAASTLWATGSLYNSNLRQLRACSLAAACPTPTELDTEGNTVVALTYYDGKHYGASFANGGGNVIFSVNDVAPGARTILVADAAGIKDVAVDASGIYWVNGTTGRVLKCATLTGCAGSGETLATGQVGALRIRLDGKFVYWMTPTSVMKVAK
jgi:hypothetical protein